MRTRSTFLPLALALVAFGCSSAGSTNTFPDDSGSQQVGPDGGGNPDDSGLTFTDGSIIGGDGGTVNNNGCSDAAKLIYVIDESGGLHSFYPPTLTFKDIGTVNCPGANGTNSMAVDRSATAWVSDNDGALFKVSTSDASCQKTAFQKGQSGFGKYGMGFSSNAAGSNDETLFIDGIGGKGLATIDLSTMKLNPIGKFDKLRGFDCELTGTGDARLYGFFTNQPASVAEIDKPTAKILSNAPQANVLTGTDWAFSFWGGDFYMYTADTSANPNDTTNVTRYRPSDGTTTVVKQQIGYRIVGAGVSTCAPVTLPK